MMVNAEPAAELSGALAHIERAHRELGEIQEQLGERHGSPQSQDNKMESSGRSGASSLDEGEKDTVKIGGDSAGRPSEPEVFADEASAAKPAFDPLQTGMYNIELEAPEASDLGRLLWGSSGSEGSSASDRSTFPSFGDQRLPGPLFQEFAPGSRPALSGVGLRTDRKKNGLSTVDWERYTGPDRRWTVNPNDIAWHEEPLVWLATGLVVLVSLTALFLI